MCTHITQFTYTHHTVHLVCLPHIDLPHESHKKVCVHTSHSSLTHITQFTWFVCPILTSHRNLIKRYVYTHHTVHLVCLPHIDLPQESHKKVCVHTSHSSLTHITQFTYTHHTVHLVCLPHIDLSQESHKKVCVHTSHSSLGMCTHITQFTWFVCSILTSHKNLIKRYVYTHHTVHLVCVHTSHSSLGLSAPY